MKKYPEEIYATRDGGLLTFKQLRNAGTGWGRRHAYKVGYEAGKAEQSNYIESISSLESVLTDAEQLDDEVLPFVKRLLERSYRAGVAVNVSTDPLAGYSNLTAAISAGEPIDWEKLDGKRVQCRNPDVGELHGMLERDYEYPANAYSAWCGEYMDDAYTTALWSAWRGTDGWTLWVEGEIPMRRKTADQLKLGTYFLGKHPDRPFNEFMYVGSDVFAEHLTIHYAPSKVKTDLPATEWEVVEEYGTFQKPEGK